MGIKKHKLHIKGGEKMSKLVERIDEKITQFNGYLLNTTTAPGIAIRIYEVSGTLVLVHSWNSFDDLIVIYRELESGDDIEERMKALEDYITPKPTE